MAFYFLHETGTPTPKDEKDFNYLIYSEKDAGKSVLIDGKKYCPHQLTETPKWNPDDEIVDVVTKHSNQIFAQFKKKHEIVGFTIWEKI